MNLFVKITNTVVKYRSEILLGFGIALGTGCVVTACVQTVKACDIILKANADLDDVDAREEANNALAEPVELEPEKERKLIRKNTTISMIKTYAVPVILGIGSVAAVLGAYKIISDQKAKALAALSTVTAAFEKYRSRVIDKYGVEADYELYNGEATRETKIVDGKEVTRVTTHPIDDNCYTKIFCFETSKEWHWKRSLNVAMLQYWENYWNNQLLSKGYVTYNEVIECLGFSRKVGDGMTERFIPNGIGWVSAENIPDELAGQYDPYISFVPKDIDSKDDLDAVYEDMGYVLRFNCYPIDNLLMARCESGK